ncbi:type I restriction enzyme HsdR N-terminal domain-containing protein [Microbacterium kribbense]|uniref:Type I restriction enzyme HsdR N-terminal domain-containing protein n=1 Tax=Microbacterium kribbense TaxID=433645 RepID=A0ABP7GGW9_9MICO
MEFDERLHALAVKVSSQAAAVETEEATKNAFVMPFISSILGYDVFNPAEVIPEFTADVGIKRGEKVDYAIVHDGDIQILIECKASLGSLKIEHASQLFRYFAATNARIAALTNGVVWQFYTDLDAPNRMDAKPFLVLDLRDVDETVLPELQKLSKANFDLGSIISAAEELKYVGALKRAIAAEFRTPSDEWVKFFTTRVYEGSYTQRVRQQFTALVPKATSQFLSERVNERLKAALTAGDQHPPQTPPVTSIEAAEDDLSQDPEIVTTMEELQGFRIVKAIACAVVDSRRVTQRDAKSYFAVLLDDNNRQPIARLHFNGKQKYLGLLDEEKNETRHPIEALDEIYAHAGSIRSAAARYA